MQLYGLNRYGEWSGEQEAMTLGTCRGDSAREEEDLKEEEGPEYRMPGLGV